MALDDNMNGPREDITADSASVLESDDSRAKTPDEGGSDVLRKATDDAATDIAASDAEGLRRRVVIAVAQIFDHCRTHARVVLFLNQTGGKLRPAAELAIKENGIPTAITAMAVEMNRLGGGMTLDYRPYVARLCEIVVEHYRLLADDDGAPEMDKKAS